MFTQMNEISQLCILLNFKEKELRRLNRLIKYLEVYKENHESAFFKIDIASYIAIRTKLTHEIKCIMKKLE